MNDIADKHVEREARRLLDRITPLIADKDLKVIAGAVYLMMQTAPRLTELVLAAIHANVAQQLERLPERPAYLREVPPVNDLTPSVLPSDTTTKH